MKKLLLILLIISIIPFLLKILMPFLRFNTRSTTSYSESPNKILEVVKPPINRPIIGIHYKIIYKPESILYSVPAGAYITKIIKDSLAEKANLQEEDIITQIDGRDLFGQDEQFIYNLISTLKPGSKVNLTIWRNKEVKNIIITLE